MGKCLWLLTKYSHCNNNQFKEESFFMLSPEESQRNSSSFIKASFCLISHISILRMRNIRLIPFISLSILIAGGWANESRLEVSFEERLWLHQTKHRVSLLLNFHQLSLASAPFSTYNRLFKVLNVCSSSCFEV